MDGDHARVEDRIAAVLNSRLSGERVRRLVDILYANAMCTLSERLLYARNPRQNPYPASFTTISGVRYEGEIACGDNPFLRARLVEEIRVEGSPPEGEVLRWREPEPPDIKAILSSLPPVVVDWY
jgi:hypothetical protein